MERQNQLVLAPCGHHFAACGLGSEFFVQISPEIWYFMADRQFVELLR